MKKNVYKQLVQACYINGTLDNTKVVAFAERLNRKQLRIFIDTLKKWIRINTIVIESAREVSKTTQEEFKKYYADKQIVYKINPELLVGIRIKDNDTIYEMNLRDSLENIKDYVTE